MAFFTLFCDEKCGFFVSVFSVVTGGFQKFFSFFKYLIYSDLQRFLGFFL